MWLGSLWSLLYSVQHVVFTKTGRQANAAEAAAGAAAAPKTARRIGGRKDKAGRYCQLNNVFHKSSAGQWPGSIIFLYQQAFPGFFQNVLYHRYLFHKKFSLGQCFALQSHNPVVF